MQEKLKNHREAYQQKKRKEPEQVTKRCAQDRQRYEKMQPEQKKARIDQITANRGLRRNTPCKQSIAMVNPAYVATQQKVGTSTLNARQTKPVTPGERQTLLRRRNEEFSIIQRKTTSQSSQDMETKKQHEVMINGNNLNFTTTKII
jgi:hypothetical protein